MDSEWEEVQGEGTVREGPTDGYHGFFVLKFPYWKNTITGDLEQQKPSGSESLRLELRPSKSGVQVSHLTHPNICSI